MDFHLSPAAVVEALRLTGELLETPREVEILLVGGMAGLLTGQLGRRRVTMDCDVMHVSPAAMTQRVREASRQAGERLDLPADWLDDRAAELNLLPDGWRARRQAVGRFGRLAVFAVSRLDLLALKVLANRPQDREDILSMAPTADELDFVARYLAVLKVPSRRADLDQVAAAERLVSALREDTAR